MNKNTRKNITKSLREINIIKCCNKAAKKKEKVKALRKS